MQLCLSSSQRVEEAARNASCSACPSEDAAASAQTRSATVLSEIKKADTALSESEVKSLQSSWDCKPKGFKKTL